MTKQDFIDLINQVGMEDLRMVFETFDRGEPMAIIEMRLKDGRKLNLVHDIRLKAEAEARVELVVDGNTEEWGHF